METVELRNGLRLPQLGLGTFHVRGFDVIYQVLDVALRCGYRLIDTASVYKNEAEIGRALQELLPKHGLHRENIFITSKLGPAEHGEERAYHACSQSLERLGVGWLDLYLIHWPGVQKLKHDDPRNRQFRKQSWLAMERLYRDGKVKSVGVSNYTVRLMEELFEYATIQPAVLQVEFHPFLYQYELQNFCQIHNVHLQAYSSLGCGKLLDHPLVVSVAASHQRSSSQVLLRWAIEHQASVIPRSVNADHIADNSKLFDFVLTADEIEGLDKLNEGCHFCWDPAAIL